MPDEFVHAEAEAVEYKAYARHFEHVGEDEPRMAVLYVVATLSMPDSGWRFVVVPQEGDPETWRLFGDAPPFTDGDRTYYIASGTTEHELDAVPTSIVVVDAKGPTRVSVVPWD